MNGPRDIRRVVAQRNALMRALAQHHVDDDLTDGEVCPVCDRVFTTIERLLGTDNEPTL